MIKKVVHSLLAISLFATMTVSVDARPLDEILKSGVLKMGVNPGLPPLAKYDEKNNLVGFDPDIGAKLAEMLGVELELVKVGSPDRIPFVSTGKIDIVMGALTRNYKRQKIVDYSVPVHTEVFGALTTNKKPFKTVMEMNRADVTLVQVRGTMPASWAQKNLPKDVLNNKARNTYFLLPLILGLIGLYFLYNTNKEYFWILILFFLFTFFSFL